MNKIGMFLLGSLLLLLFSRALKTPYDVIFGIMNNTTTLSPTESFAWRIMPYAIPLIIAAILVSVVSGHFGVLGEQEE